MATQVWWHNQGSGLWEDPTNWNDAPDGTGSFLVSFNGDEYFYFNGSGAGSSDDASLSSSTYLTCAGFGATNGQNIYIQSATTIEVQSNDNDIGDITCFLDFGYNVDPSSTLLIINDIFGFETVTIQGEGVGLQGFAEIQFASNDTSIIFSSVIVNPGATVAVPLSVSGENVSIFMDGQFLTNGGTLLNDGSPSNTVTVILSSFTAYDVRGDLFPGTVTVNNNPDTSSATTINLYVNQTGLGFALPSWCAFASDEGGSRTAGDLTVQFNTTFYSGLAPGATLQVTFLSSIFNGVTFRTLTLRDDVSSAVQSDTQFIFQSSGADWGFSITDLIMTGGLISTSSVFELRYDILETNKCDLLILDEFTTFSSLQDVVVSVHIENLDTGAPFGNYNAPSVTFGVAPGGVPPLYTVNIVQSGAFFAANNNLALNNLTFLGDCEWNTFTNANNITLTGKLTFGPGFVRWGNVFGAFVNRIDLAVSADPFYAYDATVFAPIPGETQPLQICNPNVDPILVGGPGTSVSYVEMVCGDAISYGTDDGNNVGVTFEAEPTTTTTTTTSSSTTTTPPVGGECRWLYTIECGANDWSLQNIEYEGCIVGCVSDPDWQGAGCIRTFRYCDVACVDEDSCDLNNAPDVPIPFPGDTPECCEALCCGTDLPRTTPPPPPPPPPGSSCCLRAVYNCECIAGVSTWVLDVARTECVDNGECTGEESCTPTEYISETLDGCICFIVPGDLPVPTCDPECCEDTTTTTTTTTPPPTTTTTTTTTSTTTTTPPPAAQCQYIWDSEYDCDTSTWGTPSARSIECVECTPVDWVDSGVDCIATRVTCGDPCELVGECELSPTPPPTPGFTPAVCCPSTTTTTTPPGLCDECSNTNGMEEVGFCNTPQTGFSSDADTCTWTFALQDCVPGVTQNGGSVVYDAVAGTYTITFDTLDIGSGCTSQYQAVVADTELLCSSGFLTGGPIVLNLVSCPCGGCGPTVSIQFP